MAVSGEPTDWIRMILTSGSRKEKRVNLGLLFSFWWQIWKERNRRVFVAKELSAPSFAALFRDQVAALSLALNQDSS
jgi:hypothetical protein